jgi:hypothetical protein
MNYVVIILGIIIVFLLYYIYIWMNSATTLQSSASLLDSNPPITSLKNPTNLNYAYGIWLYVNTWDNSIQKNIISRSNNFTLYLDQSTPTLKCDIKLTDSTVQTITITNNFPLQKWVYIIFSADSQIVDFYLNGKLVISQKLTNMPKVPSDASTSPLVLGGTNTWDARVANLIRTTHPMSPEEVMNNYISGYNSVSGGGIFSMNSYNANLKVLKNGEIFADTKLF